MPDHLFRVRVIRVLPGCDDVLPPIQPIQEEDDPATLVLSDCYPWNMQWPKSQIRLGARGNTPKTTPPEVPVRSHGKTAAPPLPSPPRKVVDDEDLQMAQDPADEDNFDFLAEDFDGGQFITNAPAEEPYLSTEARLEAAPSEKSHCKRLFGSQDNTPPDARPCTEPQTGTKGGVIFSPGTIHKVAGVELAKELKKQGPKPRKRGPRSSKGAKAACQPASMPLHVQDGPPISKDTPPVHVMGQPMLTEKYLKAASGDMRSLHAAILYLETSRIQNSNPAYPVFIAKVPKGLGFIESTGADMIVLRFSDIFDVFHVNPLHHSFVRLFSLNLARQIIRDKTPGIAIVDPYYMRQDVLGAVGNQVVAVKYLEDFMLANEDKDYILVPYFPRLVIPLADSNVLS